MTSGVFSTWPIDQIIVNRDVRQRRNPTKRIEGMVEEIRKRGLIHPLLITRDGVLVVGERRLEALKRLGWTHVPVQFQDEVDWLTLYGIELAENIKREDLEWQEEVDSVYTFHQGSLARDPAWTQAQTGEFIGVTQPHARTMIKVGGALIDPTISQETRDRMAAAETLSSAFRILQTEEEYRAKAEKASLGYAEKVSIGYGEISGLYDDGPGRDDHTDHTILCARFEDWAATYEGPRFNLIHCDFPYGIGFDRMGTQAGSALGRYEDGPDAARALLQTFVLHLDKFAEDSCHLVFWFSMQNYDYTYRVLTAEAGFDVDPFPLMWMKSDNTGIVPDAAHGPRRIYETAFFGRRDNRRLIEPKSNAFAWPASGKLRPHEKPREVLEYFFGMFVNEHTTLFDPTCGSGSALRAAKRLGAQRSLGLEANERFVGLARAELEGEPGHAAGAAGSKIDLKDLGM